MGITVHDIIIEPCGCDHENKWRNGGNVFLVVQSIKSCIFAKEGRCLGCAHTSREAGFFQIDARTILINRMMEISRNGNADILYDVLTLQTLYRLKHFLDILKRKACGGAQKTDKTPEEILNFDEVQNIPEDDSLRLHFFAVIVLADKMPKDLEQIAQFDNIHLATDKILCDRMQIILTKVQQLTPR